MNSARKILVTKSPHVIQCCVPFFSINRRQKIFIIYVIDTTCVCALMRGSISKMVSIVRFIWPQSREQSIVMHPFACRSLVINTRTCIEECDCVCVVEADSQHSIIIIYPI